MFGWEDIFRERYYTTSVYCYSKSAQVIKIPAKDFLNYLKKDEKIYKQFGDVSLQRDQTTINKIKDSNKMHEKL